MRSEPKPLKVTYLTGRNFKVDDLTMDIDNGNLRDGDSVDLSTVIKNTLNPQFNQLALDSKSQITQENLTLMNTNISQVTKSLDFSGLSEVVNTYRSTPTLNLYHTYTSHVDLHHYGVKLGSTLVIVPEYFTKDGKVISDIYSYLWDQDFHSDTDLFHIDVEDSILRVTPVTEDYQLSHIKYVYIIKNE